MLLRGFGSCQVVDKLADGAEVDVFRLSLNYYHIIKDILGLYFADAIFKCIFLNEMCGVLDISVKTSLKLFISVHLH